MLKKGNAVFAAMLCAALLVIGCAQKAAEQGQYSGFLKDYSKIEKTKDLMGEPVLRYISPRLTQENYTKILIEPIQYYPQPNPTENVSAQTLEDIRNYVEKMFRLKVGEKVSVVNQPGPSVARMRVALTAVGTQTEGMKPYQFIPVALVITGAQTAVSGKPQEAALYLEAEMSDSISGERLGVAVRRGTGERLKKMRQSEAEITVESLKPMLDRWADAYANFVFENFAAK